MSCGSLILSPVFGWMLDARGPFQPIFLTAGACALGCLIRGTATDIRGLQIGALVLGIGVNLWIVVLAHIANSSDRKHRSAVISGFSVQNTVLRLTGKGLSPLWDMFVYNTLNVQTTLPRYRVHMAICTLFCLFGWLALLVERLGGQVTSMDQATPHMEEESGRPMDDDDSQKQTSQEANKSSAKDGESCSVTYVILIFALLAQSFASTVVMVLWPLFLRDRYSFTASEFGLALFVTSLSSTLSIASFPKFERKFGASCTASLCALIAALTCLAGFVLLPCPMSGEEKVMEEMTALQVEEGPLALREFEGLHLALAICLQTSLLTLEPSLKSVFSLHVPARVQGRSIGLMATIGGVGGMAGNLIGTYLYQVSKDDGHTAARVFGGPLSSQGRFPFLVVSTILGIASLLIGFEGYQSKDRTGESHHSLLSSEEAESRTEEGEGGVCCGGEMETEDVLAQSLVTPSIGSLLNLETSYDLKLD